MISPPFLICNFERMEQKEKSAFWLLFVYNGSVNILGKYEV